MSNEPRNENKGHHRAAWIAAAATIIAAAITAGAAIINNSSDDSVGEGGTSMPTTTTVTAPTTTSSPNPTTTTTSYATSEGEEYRRGSATIRFTQSIDLDELENNRGLSNTRTNQTDFELTFDIRATTQKIAIVDTIPTLDDCKNSNIAASIPYADIKKGETFCILTTEDRWARVTFTDVRFSGNQNTNEIDIDLYVWQK